MKNSSGRFWTLTSKSTINLWNHLKTQGGVRFWALNASAVKHPNISSRPVVNLSLTRLLWLLQVKRCEQFDQKFEPDNRQFGLIKCKKEDAGESNQQTIKLDWTANYLTTTLISRARDFVLMAEERVGLLGLYRVFQKKVFKLLLLDNRNLCTFYLRR